jgi:DNA-repair protein XRCC3
MSSRTALDMWRDQRFPPISVGCASIDASLGGGICSSGVTEIVGEAGCGKTQIALVLSVQIQLRTSGCGECG